MTGGDGSATRLDLASLDPYLGLPRDAPADGRLEVELADAGLVVIENFACFEAFCRGEVEQPLRSTVAWTALSALPGVREVRPRLARKRLYVRYEPARLRERELVGAVKRADFEGMEA